MSEIFVFGSNLLGIHKKGAALCALREHGAILGQAIGHQGNSYAIPTKRTPYEKLSLHKINHYVSAFILYASNTPEHDYLVTPIGCGLAGYTPEDIAFMFYYATRIENINLPIEFLDILLPLDLIYS